MKQMTEQLGMYFQMYKAILGEKAGDERGDAVQWILIVLAGIAIVALVVGAITTFVQNKTAELGN